MAFGALSSGISALNSFSKGMEVIGNNIANVNTVSFKSSRIKYSETFNQVLKQSAPSPSSGDRSNVQASQVGLGVQVEGIVGQFHQGGISSTSQLTDLAISGEGFFLVEDPKSGTQFATRGGDFRIDDQGYLVTSGGMRVQGLTNGSIGFEVDVTSDGEWKFNVNEDSQTGTVKPSDYGDIRLDYSKSDAEVVDEAFLSGDQTRNAVMYTNYLIGQDSNGGSSFGDIVFKKDSNGNDTNIIDMEATVYGAAADSPHRVGGFVYNDTTNPTQITSVTGWNAFVRDSVADLKTLRNVSSQGNISGIVTDAEIERAVSSDFFFKMFGAEITEQNNAVIAGHTADVVSNWNAGPGDPISATDFIKLAPALDAIDAWNSLNPSNTLSRADLVSIENVQKSIATWNADNPTRNFDDSDLATIGTMQDAISAWNAANSSAAIEIADLATINSVKGSFSSVDLEGYTYATYQNAKDSLGQWNDDTAIDITTADLGKDMSELIYDQWMTSTPTPTAADWDAVVAAGDADAAISHWNSTNKRNQITLANATDTVQERVVALWNSENSGKQISTDDLSTYSNLKGVVDAPGSTVTLADAELLISSNNAVANWNGLNPTNTIDTDDYELLRSADDAVAAWNTANPGSEISLQDLSMVLAAEGAIANWNAGHPTNSLKLSDFNSIKLATDVVNSWNTANPNEPKTIDLLAKGAITLDGNAVRDLFSATSGLTWDNTIDVDATLESILSSMPQNFTEAKSLVSAVTREQTPELSRFSIDDEGGIIYFLNNGDSFTRGQIQLVDFNDKTALIREGQNLYSAFGAAGLKENPYGTNGDGLQVAGTNGLGLIKQGALELSNVDLTTEFANMITTQRGFQAGSRIITVSDDILQEVVNLKR